MSLALKFYRFSWLLLPAMLLLAACGDSSATSTVPAAIATATRPATTLAATTAQATTAAATTAPVTTVAPTTAAATTAPVTTAAATTTAASATTSAAVDPQKAEAGHKVFVMQCNGCHVEEGKKAGYGPNLSTSQNALNPDYVRGNVRNGRGKMVAFDKSEVSDADLENIILYLRSIHQN